MFRALVSVPRTAARSISVSSLAAAEQPTKREVEDLFSDDAKPARRQMYSKNRVEIVGGVALDPLSKIGRNNSQYTLINVITNYRQRVADGQYEDRNERHVVTVFGKAAEFAARDVKKGSRVMIEGRLHYTGGELLADGKRTPRQTHIHAESVQVLARRDAINGPNSEEQTKAPRNAETEAQK